MDPREADLIRKFQQGDDDAANAVARRFAPVIVGLVYANVGRTQDAEDLVQEILLEAQQSIDRLRDPTRFRSWIYKITQRVCTRWRRSSGRAPDLLDSPEHVLDRESTGIEPERAKRIREVVATMKAPLREVIHMRYFQELPYEHIAEFLGISTAAVNARLIKARQLLGERLRDESGA